jgi:hypothetical protein
MANSPKPLGAFSRAIAAIRGRLYQPPQSTIDGVNQQAFPSALQPVQPTAPAGSQPLAFSFWQGINQEITPRADTPLTFGDLRQLGTYPLARICIENVKDILCTLPWKIQLKRNTGEPVAEWKNRAKTDKTIPMLTDFFSYPDGETPWGDWLRPIIEDLLVIDAPCFLAQRTLAGKVVSLRWTDGSQILRLITDQGYTPQGDNPAYTQLWEGIPRLLLTTRQLIYRPSNIVARNGYASKLYGMPITEQLAQEIDIGQNRLNFVLAYYKDGIDGGLRQVVPAGILPDKVSENVQAFNNIMAGNLGKRRQMNVIQGYHPVDGEKEDQFVETTAPILSDVWDDLHIRKICFGYGTSAQRLLKQMNRASAEAGQDASEKEGIMPRLKWLKSTMDYTIQKQMDFPQYEMVWDTDDELDAVKQATVDTDKVKSGLRTIDEIREDRGEIPFNLPETQKPIIITATGVQPLEGSFDRVEQAAKDASTVANKPVPKPVPVSATGKKAINDFYANTGY